MLTDLLWKMPYFKKAARNFFEIKDAIDILHSRIDVPDELREEFMLIKNLNPTRQYSRKKNR